MARVTTVITSINSNTSEAVTVSSAYSGTDGTITLSASVPAGVKVGDIITDSATNSFLITALPGGSDLTCQDFETTTDPATGAANITEAYATVALWAADLDADVSNTEVYKASDDAQGELYGQANETVNVTLGGTIGLASITLTVPVAERHDGTAAAGSAGNAGIVRTGASSGEILLDCSVQIPTTFSWLELDGNAQPITTLCEQSAGGTDGLTVEKCIIHGNAYAGNTYGARGSSGPLNLQNCFIYDILNNGGGAAAAYGVDEGTGGTVQYQNVTIHDVEAQSTSGPAACFSDGNTVQNCIGTDPTGNGTVLCFTGTPGTEDHNLSSDTSAAGTGSLQSKTSANQFVQPSGPSYDLHLLDTDADAFEAGTDLGTTNGVNIDIDNFDRNAGATTWSMGGHDGNNLRGGPPTNIDTQSKRMSVRGAGRPWARTAFPEANSVGWRMARGAVYNGNPVGAPPAPGGGVCTVIGGGVF